MLIDQHQQNGTSPSKTALVLGATGGFGSALCDCLASRGWQVKALTRNRNKASASASNHNTENLEWVYGDLDTPESLKAAAANVDVIVHAVNVPYPKWDPLMIEYTRSILELAQSANAHLLFVGNVYNAGIPSSGVITEDTQDAPVSEKGHIRATLEEMILAASENGLRATVMRFGDFFGSNIQTSNWFNMCTKDISKNKMSKAGSLDIPHTWAYLPDAVDATEAVLSVRVADRTLPNHMVLPFAGHVFSFTQLHEVLQSTSAEPIKIGSIPWGLFKVLALFMPLMRDLLSMRYLWQHDIRMDGAALESLLGQPPTHTPLELAVKTSVPILAEASI